MSGETVMFRTSPATDSHQRTRPAVEFWSSTENSTFLDGLQCQLREEGFDASHQFGISEENYRSGRSRIARWILRWRAYGVYPLKLAWHFRRPRRQVVGVVTTNTFFAPRFALGAATRETPIVHWVYDLYPDVLVAAGAARAGSWAERRMHAVVRRTFDLAAANVFLGEKLRRHAERRFGLIPRSHVIPIGADGRPFRECPPLPGSSGAPSHILYSGNLGRMHDVETVSGAIQTGLPDGLRLEFRGGGAGFRQLENALRSVGKNAAVELGGHLPEAEWVKVMKMAHVALVTLRPGAEGLVIPSKTYSAMVAGQAILAICPGESDLAALVRTHDCGWVIEPGDIEGLRQCWRQIATDQVELQRKRERSYAAGHAHYDSSVLAKLWVRLFHELADGAGMTRPRGGAS